VKVLGFFYTIISRYQLLFITQIYFYRFYGIGED